MMVHFRKGENPHRAADPAVLGLLRAKKAVLSKGRRDGRIDYDRAREIEAELDAAIAAELLGTPEGVKPNPPETSAVGEGGAGT